MATTNLLMLWNSLRSAKTPGLVKQLYNASLPITIYATYQYPDNLFGIGFSALNSVRYDLSKFQNLSELRITQFDDASMAGYRMFHIQLIDSENIRVFSALCEDLISTIEPLQKSTSIIRGVLSQIVRWDKLFGKARTSLLSGKEQQGLYGEIYFLKKRLKHTNDTSKYHDVVSSWTGVEKTNKDFQGNGWGVEVKTTSTNNPQKVTINGERQLDDTLVAKLFLFHLTVEISKMSGQSLPGIIKEVKDILNVEQLALCTFEAKLFEAGYKDSDSTKYDKLYAVRNEDFYKVTDKFPRIIETDLRKGVCEVTYAILLETCDSYLITEAALLKQLED